MSDEYAQFWASGAKTPKTGTRIRRLSTFQDPDLAGSIVFLAETHDRWLRPGRRPHRRRGWTAEALTGIALPARGLEVEIRGISRTGPDAHERAGAPPTSLERDRRRLRAADVVGRAAVRIGDLRSSLDHEKLFLYWPECRYKLRSTTSTDLSSFARIELIAASPQPSGATATTVATRTRRQSARSEYATAERITPASAPPAAPATAPSAAIAAPKESGILLP
ncbi:hypothetical protein [Rhodococcus erythropolis]|uniref:hypothetical protein n=1 Tax=Rhodococcus erythropolis TaxID=1833 RepID=UPI00159F67F6|nr:hypothetical protein [Rhodococcus erythropolis]